MIAVRSHVKELGDVSVPISRKSPLRKSGDLFLWSVICWQVWHFGELEALLKRHFGDDVTFDTQVNGNARKMNLNIGFEVNDFCASHQ